MKLLPPDTCLKDYKKRRSAFLEELIASTPNVSVRAKEFRGGSTKTHLIATMTKLKTRVALSLSLDAESPLQPVTLVELVAEARAIDWDFTTWCCVTGYDASDPNARRMFECLLAYARREGCAGLH